MRALERGLEVELYKDLVRWRDGQICSAWRSSVERMQPDVLEAALECRAKLERRVHVGISLVDRARHPKA